MVFADVPEIIFSNKQNIPWNDVEKYLKRFIGQEFRLEVMVNPVRMPMSERR